MSPVLLLLLSRIDLVVLNEVGSVVEYSLLCFCCCCVCLFAQVWLSCVMAPHHSCFCADTLRSAVCVSLFQRDHRAQPVRDFCWAPVVMQQRCVAVLCVCCFHVLRVSCVVAQASGVC